MPENDLGLTFSMEVTPTIVDLAFATEVVVDYENENYVTATEENSVVVEEVNVTYTDEVTVTVEQTDVSYG